MPCELDKKGQPVKHIDPKKLYSLRPGEEVMFRLADSLTPCTRYEAISDPRVGQLHAEALRIARQIIEGPELEETGSVEIEMQGRYKSVRVVPAKDIVKGHRIKGWTLVGVLKQK